MGVLSERKRPAEDQELDGGEKRLHRSSEKEFDGYDIDLQSSSEYRSVEGVEHELISNVLVTENDDIFLYPTGNGGVYNESIEHLIINGDFTTNTNTNTACETEFSRYDYASSDHHGCYSAINGSSDLQKNEEEGRSEMGNCYDHGSPLEGLDLFFDDVGLGFGVHEDDSLEFVAELVKRPGEGCEILSEVGACSGVSVSAEQTFIEENEVHDWLFGGSQRSPGPDSLQGCCTGGDHLLVLNDPSLAHVFEGMAAGT